MEVFQELLSYLQRGFSTCINYTALYYRCHSKNEDIKFLNRNALKVMRAVGDLSKHRISVDMGVRAILMSGLVPSLSVRDIGDWKATYRIWIIKSYMSVMNKM